jgi:hypothetical protein
VHLPSLYVTFVHLALKAAILDGVDAASRAGGTCVKPSETDAGAAWLTNFTREDRQYAEMLVDSVQFASSSTVVEVISRSILRILESFQDESTAAIFPVRDLHDLKAKSREKSAVMFKDGLRPTALIRVDPGSESFISTEIRNFRVRAAPRIEILEPQLELADLRNSKCRAVLLVDDYAGSGGRFLTYAAAWARNPTIRSWRSFGWIRIHAVIFAASATAQRRIEASGYVDSLHAAEQAPEFETARWNEDERKAIRALCLRNAAPRTRPLGFRKGEALFAMEHTVPNTVPAVLHQTESPASRRSTPWEPFLPGRYFPPNLRRQLRDYRPIASTQDLLMRTQYSKIDGDKLAERGDVTKTLVLVLVAVGSGMHHAPHIAGELGMSVHAVQELLDALVRLGLLTLGTHLTDAGHEELRRAGMKTRRSRFSLIGSDVVYYPTQLRGVGDV